MTAIVVDTLSSLPFPCPLRTIIPCWRAVMAAGLPPGGNIAAAVVGALEQSIVVGRRRSLCRSIHTAPASWQRQQESGGVGDNPNAEQAPRGRPFTSEELRPTHEHSKPQQVVSGTISAAATALLLLMDLQGNHAERLSRLMESCCGISAAIGCGTFLLLTSLLHCSQAKCGVARPSRAGGEGHAFRPS